MGVTSSPQEVLHTGFDARGFLEALRNRVLRVTLAMRPGVQRLELAIEVFWYAALETKAGEQPVPWSTYARPDHPQRGLLVPVRLMLRSELIHCGIARPDSILDEVMGRLLAVAQEEARLGRAQPALRERFFAWLRATVRTASPLAVEPVG
ncbi:hypothetical protein SAMN04488120_10616 [Fontimonas thermophila]|uniref:Uncharacterized protein n=2 Tax=Fontimonas thermophila TaxID=1076937 RepID=A0A1I2J8V7_9GAMM|nr:hypothetical protein SAMN04488120_10616 [Fontimonas thermophila]